MAISVGSPSAQNPTCCLKENNETLEGWFSFRKISIGSDWTFSILYYPHHRTKKNRKYFSSLSSGLRITGSNWNRKLVTKAHARVQFCSDPVRSHRECLRSHRDPPRVFKGGFSLSGKYRAIDFSRSLSFELQYLDTDQWTHFKRKLA